MDKLGKKIHAEEKSVRAYAYTPCANCPCGHDRDSFQSKQNDNRNHNG